MKNNKAKPSPLLLLILIPLLLVQRVEAAVLIFSESFEDAANINYSTSGSFSDGENDYFIHSHAPALPTGFPEYRAFEGTGFWALEDVDAPENSAGVAIIQFSDILIESSVQVTFSLMAAAASQAAFDALDDFLIVEYRLNNGGWNTALALQNDGSEFNSPLLQDTDLDGWGDAHPLDLDFRTLQSQSIDLVAGLLDVRIDAYFNAGAEAVAFDNFRITAVPEPMTTALTLGLSAFMATLLRRRFSGYRPESS